MSKARVYLDSLKESDLPLLFEWINNEELVAYNNYFKPVSYEEHRSWFDKITGDESKRIFGIRLKENDQLVGSCQLHSIHPVYKSAELQIRLGDLKLTSKGLGSEAIALLLKFGFYDLNLNKVYLYVFATNKRAIKAYEKTGFKHEGTLRKQVFINGEFIDLFAMGILKEEYEKQSANGGNSPA